MGFDRLIHRGPKNCSKLEKFADVALYFPRVMWASRDITIYTATDGKSPQIASKNARSYANFLESVDNGNPLSTLIMIVAGIFFAVSSILALPFLGVGIACKKIALEKDPQSKKYHEMFERLVYLIPQNERYARRLSVFKEINLKNIQKDIERIENGLKNTIVPQCTPDVQALVQQQRDELLEIQKSYHLQRDNLIQEVASIDGFLSHIHQEMMDIFSRIKPQLTDEPQLPYEPKVIAKIRN